MNRRSPSSWFAWSLVLLLGCSTTNSGGTLDAGVDAAGGRGPGPDLGGLGGPGTVVFVNTCTQTVWAGALNNGSTTFIPNQGGWRMDPGTAYTLTLPTGWGGRFWGRTGCTFDQNGQGQCDSADCGGKLQCNGAGGKPPASLVEIQLNGVGGKDIYDVSLVDGSNVPIAIAPQKGTFTRGNPNNPYDCGAPACAVDLNLTCPASLQQLVNGKVVGCRSAHQACDNDPTNSALACAQTDDLYRCSSGGPNNVVGSCYSTGASNQCCGCPSWSPAGACNGHNPKWELPALPETFAKVFKSQCPSAYSFPFDDPTSTFSCQPATNQGTGYQITFCP